MSTGELNKFGFGSIIAFFRVGPMHDTPGGLYRAESTGPSHAEVGLDYGSCWSGQGEGEVQ